jgi:G:T/U-mismatch repair DNA glycosylase
LHPGAQVAQLRRGQARQIAADAAGAFDRRVDLLQAERLGQQLWRVLASRQSAQRLFHQLNGERFRRHKSCPISGRNLLDTSSRLRYALSIYRLELHNGQ